MFTDADFEINFAPVSSDPELIFIPVSDELGVMAVAKAFGNGKAACIVFAPAVKLGSSFEGYVPKYLRKVITSDFSLRTGQWPSVGLSKKNAAVLRDTVLPLMTGLEELNESDIEVIEMDQPSNMSSAPAVASNAYRADESTPFEKAICHLMDLQHSDSKKTA